MNNAAVSDIEQEIILSRQFIYINEQDSLKQMFDRLRWRNGRHCPRCASNLTKEIKSTVFRDMNRCVDCGYMFNSMSGTLFQGAKLPLVRLLQFYAILDATGPDVNPKDIVYAIDVSYRTAVALKRKAEAAPCQVPYVLIDPPAANLLVESRGRAQTALNRHPEFEKFHAYCESNSMVFRPSLFEDRLLELLAASNPE